MTAIPAWTPVWTLPNVLVNEPIEATSVALVARGDGRVLAIEDQHPVLGTFLGCFRNEFDDEIDPSLIIFRDDLPSDARTVAAMSGFRDAICVSAVVLSHARALKWRRPNGIQFSDAFDPYPWMLGRAYDEHITALTTSVHALHDVRQLRAQSAPALGERCLDRGDIDHVLLRALLERWGDHYAAGHDTVVHRRLFRSLDMARVAARMPGGTDATIHGFGRAVALWVSAFEILAHDGRADLPRVLALLGRVDHEDPRLRTLDRTIQYRGTTPTNLAGVIYKRLYDIRNDFLHGNPVTDDSLRLPSGRSALRFAGPLFRVALAGYLGLGFHEASPDPLVDLEGYAAHVGRRLSYEDALGVVEEALLLADTPSPDGRP